MDNNTVSGIYETLKEILVTEFKIDAASISPEKRLEDDLDLDSLDEVDILLALSNHIGEKIDPTLFKDAVTMQDIVDLLIPLWK